MGSFTSIIIIIIINDIYIAQIRTMPQVQLVHNYTLNKKFFNLFLNVFSVMSGARNSTGSQCQLVKIMVVAVSRIYWNTGMINGSAF